MIKTKEDVLNTIVEKNIKFIRTQFTDTFGTIKSWAIPAENLEDALDNGVMFDGSSITGFTRIEESDMTLIPDPNTFCILPWRLTERGAVARIIGDVKLPDGTPFEGDPRYILKKAIKKAEKEGFTMNVGPELEFFLFKLDEKGHPTLELTDHGGYFDFEPLDRAQDVRRDIDFALEDMGFKIEASHHEVAPSQHEVNFKFDDVLITTDNVITFKYVVKSIAYAKGYYATFMPKPIYGENGSGMHTNQSLFKNGTNAFYDPNSEDGLSQIALYYIGGLLSHIKDFTAVTNPLVNSYKRLVPGYEAPIYRTWSDSNRSSLIRIPAMRGTGTRVELRNPDPSCNPYLSFALMLCAGLYGIKNKIDPGEPSNFNIFDMDNNSRIEKGIESLPRSLEDAITNMKKSAFVKSVLGDHAFHNYLNAKILEWNEYKAQVHKWEIDTYFEKY